MRNVHSRGKEPISPIPVALRMVVLGVPKNEKEKHLHGGRFAKDRVPWIIEAALYMQDEEMVKELTTIQSSEQEQMLRREPDQ